MQKLHGNGEFSKYVLSRITIIAKTNIQLNKVDHLHGEKNSKMHFKKLNGG